MTLSRRNSKLQTLNLKLTEGQNLLFAVAEKHGWKEEPRDPNKGPRQYQLNFHAYHYRRKNDIILMLFDGEIMSLDESE